MPPPAISTRGARAGSSLLGIGTLDGSGVVELEEGAAAGASATAFAATTRGTDPCCSWERDEKAATRVEEAEEDEASKDERRRGERIGASDGADDNAEERHPDALLLETAATARPVAAAPGSGISFALR